ncbi:MAG: GNAT family N-acetyltransferase [Clostridiales bacterium]|nr:GNAT family N-acetyltransferase [Clostridiales bacterium]
MKPTEEQLQSFLKNVDNLFPVPISSKQNLKLYTRKLIQKATICYEEDKRGDIISLVAGYTDGIVNNMAYIALVATLPSYSNKGKTTKLIKEFIKICKKKKIPKIHLYTAATNEIAIHMYKKIGFVNKIIDDEPRPNDVHFFLDIVHEIK